jgi:hypothetical protein
MFVVFYKTSIFLFRSFKKKRFYFKESGDISITKYLKVIYGVMNGLVVNTRIINPQSDLCTLSQLKECSSHE